MKATHCALRVSVVAFALFAVSAGGCGDDKETAKDSAVNDAAADAPAADASGDMMAADSAADGSADGAAAPSYASDLQPILQAKCGPCHTVQGAGGVDHAVSYAATQESSTVCAGKKVYECILTRIQNGSMPQGAGCSGDPVSDAANSACLTQSEQDVIEGWISAGAPQ